MNFKGTCKEYQIPSNVTSFEEARKAKFFLTKKQIIISITVIILCLSIFAGKSAIAGFEPLVKDLRLQKTTDSGSIRPLSANNKRVSIKANNTIVNKTKMAISLTLELYQTCSPIPQQEISGDSTTKPDTDTNSAKNNSVEQNKQEPSTDISVAEEQRIQQQIADVIKSANSKHPTRETRPIKLTWPSPSVHTISSGFGMRYHPILHVNILHSGIDIPVCTGSQVVAAANGKVIWAGYKDGYGYTIIIANGGNIHTVYGHLSSYAVHAGDNVKAGQTIALSGGAPGHPGAGNSTGPHLHFEVRINAIPQNPESHL